MMIGGVIKILVPHCMFSLAPHSLAEWGFKGKCDLAQREHLVAVEAFGEVSMSSRVRRPVHRHQAQLGEASLSKFDTAVLCVRGMAH